MAVAVSLVVIQMDTVILTHDLQVMIHVRQQFPTDLNRAGIFYGWFPLNLIIRPSGKSSILTHEHFPSVNIAYCENIDNKHKGL
jgi:hypothetical protein